MTKIVNVVVTCTKRKAKPIPQELMLRDVSGKTVASRVRSWGKRLQKAPAEPVSVRDLYSGDHWSIARDLESLSNGKRQLRVWVVSAGYGLLKLDDRIQPYSATFSRKHPDSVVSDVASAADWWNALIREDSKQRGPRSLVDLTSAESQNCLVLVASATYLHAILGDLEEAVNRLDDPQQLSIISSGTRSLGLLTDQLVPCNARLQQAVGGIRRSLNVRLAHKILKETSRSIPTLPLLREKFQTLLNDAPELQRYDRIPMTDEQVRMYIRVALNKNPNASHTPLLTQLRANGNACEQKRFRALFREIQGAFNGQEK